MNVFCIAILQLYIFYLKGTNHHSIHSPLQSPPHCLTRLSFINLCIRRNTVILPFSRFTPTYKPFVTHRYITVKPWIRRNINHFYLLNSQLLVVKVIDAFSAYVLDNLSRHPPSRYVFTLGYTAD